MRSGSRTRCWGRRSRQAECECGEHCRYRGPCKAPPGAGYIGAMKRLRLLLLLAVALVATPWGVGDARVRGGVRRVRGQLECAAELDRGGPDAAGPATPAPCRHDHHQTPHSSVAFSASPLGLLAGFAVSRVSLRFIGASAKPISTPANSSRAPPSLA